MDQNQAEATQDDYKNKWLFDINQKPVLQSSELSFGRVKAFLYESLLRCISKHDLNESFGLLKLLAKETALDPYVLFRFVMILIESNPTKSVNKNVIIYLESLLSKLDVRKPDVFIEFLAYFIRHNRIDDARELLGQRHRFISSQIHRSLPDVDINLRCYEFFLNYLNWSQQFDYTDVKTTIDVSIQGWIVNAIDCLKVATTNHEYFVMCVVRVLLFYGYSKKAYLFVSQFQRNNPDNLGAQLLHHYLINQFDPRYVKSKKRKAKLEARPERIPTNEERNQLRSSELEVINNFSSNIEDESFDPNKYPVSEDRKEIVKNLRRLDPTLTELMELSYVHDNLIDVLKDLMDGMETLGEICNMSRWRRLSDVLEEIFKTNNEALIIDACFLWQTRYRRFWKRIDFVTLAGDQISETDKNLISEVQSTLNKKLNRSIQ